MSEEKKPSILAVGSATPQDETMIAAIRDGVEKGERIRLLGGPMKVANEIDRIENERLEESLLDAFDDVVTIERVNGDDGYLLGWTVLGDVFVERNALPVDFSGEVEGEGHVEHRQQILGIVRAAFEAGRRHREAGAVARMHDTACDAVEAVFDRDTMHTVTEIVDTVCGAFGIPVPARQDEPLSRTAAEISADLDDLRRRVIENETKIAKAIHGDTADPEFLRRARAM